MESSHSTWHSGVRKPADEGPDQSEDDVLTASLGYGLLWCVHTYIDAHGFVEETDDRSVLLDDASRSPPPAVPHARDYASGKIKPAQDYTLAEIALLIALASLLHDWFPHEDQTWTGFARFCPWRNGIAFRHARSTFVRSAEKWPSLYSVR